jgi:hypothetical protein
VYAAEAAVELLIGHRWWLHREDFVDAFVGTDRSWVSGAAVAWIDWTGAVAALDGGRLSCSSGEAQVLRVAASMAAGVPVDLRDALCGLDVGTVASVARAVAHAGGHRDATIELAGPR